MAYDLGVTARQRYIRPTYSAVGGFVTADAAYYYHTFVTTGTFTNTSAIPIPIQIVDGAGNVVQSTTVPAFGTFNAVTTSSGAAYAVHTFNSSGAFTAASSLTNVSALLVAGGGGGGYGRTGNHAGGGGGAGGVRYYQNLDVASGAKTITVGGGGAAFTQGVGSSITGFPVSVVNPTGGGGGGGGGGADGFPGGIGPTGGGNGGSGGGGSPGWAVAGGTGIAGEGFNGAGTPFNGEGGSGGGAGAAGSTNIGSVGAAGGIGRLINITGTSTYYGGGGGSPNTTAGLGGLGGGGTGAGASTPATAGTPNTGGGGGGATPPNIIGGSGGSGVVIISYPSALGVATGGTITAGTGPGLTIRYLAPPSNSPDPNFKNTTLLLSTDATTTFVDDASPFNNNISILGDTEPDSFNPYAENYSLNFNGSTSSFLRVASTSTAAFGSNDFTVEAWIYVTGSTGTYRTIYSTRPIGVAGTVYTGGSFGVNPTGGLYWYTGEFLVNNASDLLLTNRWNHVAVSRRSGYTVIFLNGSLIPNTDSTPGANEVPLSYLVVAGGGGGGGGVGNGGGGGAGGYRTGSLIVTPLTSYAVIVGAGGAGGGTAGATTGGAYGSDGQTSTFFTINSSGGGGGATGTGGSSSAPGRPGGSGGGASNRSASAPWYNGGAGNIGGYTPVEGYNGGGTTATSGIYGGGGAGGPASSGVGGIGAVNSISGTSAYYAGGGGSYIFLGGQGGGGFGGNYLDPLSPAAGGSGTPNTGGGGGGGGGFNSGQTVGGAGGSGIVILSHITALPQATVTGNPTIITTGSNIVYIFTASGTISFELSTSSNSSNALTLTTATIGANLNGSEPFSGYISNLRVVKGQGLYTDQFVVGTRPLTTATIGHSSINSAITGTVALLAAASNRFVDKSPANLAITGTAVVSNLQPFNYQFDSNGSAYFDGTGDYLTVPASTSFQFPGDFTIEGWMYFTNTAGGSPQALFSVVNGATEFDVRWHTNRWSISLNAGVGTDIGATPAPVNNVWTHVACVRSGSAIRLYVNGVATGTTLTNSSTLGQAASVASIGASNIGNNIFTGYISNIRVVNGTAVYTSNFTPSTSPLTAIPNTVLLTLQNNSVANNRAFRDASDSNAIITPVGTTVAQGTVNSFGQGWSGYFDGTGDYLTVPFSSSFVFNGNFTIEGWINPATLPALNSQKYIIASWNTGSNLRSFYVILQNIAGVNLLVLGLSSDGTSANAASVSLNWTPAVSTWSHFAIVRTGSAVTMYANGVSLGTGTLSTVNFSAGSAISIGADAPGLTAAFYWNGYISNFRVVKGTAVYTANFTPPTSDLPCILNTVLLTLQSNRFVDNSENNFTITRLGDTRIERFSPYRTPGYNSLINSGSMYFNGLSDYLNIAYDARHVIGTRDFTIDAWVYPLSFATTNKTILSSAPSLATGSYYLALEAVSGVLSFYFTDPSIPVYTGTTSVNLNSWSHVSVTRQSGTLYFWINGQLDGSITFLTSIDVAGGLRVGSGRAISNFFSGYISDLRFVVGTALYIGPTAEPLTAIGNTVLLAAQSSTLVDNSTYGNTINGSTIISTSMPFSIIQTTSGAPNYSFDGSGDMLTVNLLPGPGTATDFTYEAWVYPTSGSVVYRVIFGIDNYGSGAAFRLYQYGAAFQYWYNGSGGFIDSGVILINRWHHLAITRNGISIRFFVNGNQVGTTLTTTVNHPTSNFRIGMDAVGSFPFVGRISNLRVINGTAIYTSNFAVPTGQLTAIANTVLLTAQDTSFRDNSTNNYSVVASGNVSIENQFLLPANGYYSYSFNGTDQVLSVANTSTLNFGSNDFTIEAWIYPTSVSAEKVIVSLYGYSKDRRSWYLGISGGNIRFRTTNATGSASNLDSLRTLLPNTWYFISAIKQGTTRRIYINGQTDASDNAPATLYNNTVDPIYIGAVGPNLTGYFAGLISNLRILNGTARIPDTNFSNSFTVPQVPAKVVPNTVLLLNGTNSAVVDRTGRNDLATVGEAKLRKTFYYDNQSVLFPGSGSYLNIPYSALHDLSNGNFTIEAWVFPTTTGAFRGLINNWQTGGQFQYYLSDSNTLGFNWTNAATGVSSGSYVGTTPITANAWTHIATVRNGTSLTHYINGVIDAGGSFNIGTQTLFYYNGEAKDLRIGVGGDLGTPFTGTISDVRMVKGTAVYTANFTRPTTRLTAIANTLLLTCRGTEFRDYSSNNFAVNPVGTPTLTPSTQFGQSSFTQTSPFVSSIVPNSMYFDGTGDYLLSPTNPNFSFGTGDFTIETWVNFSALAANRLIVDCWVSAGTGAWQLYYSSTTTKIVWYVNNAIIVSSTTTPLVNTWYHIAVARSGSTVKIFINGVEEGSAAHTTDLTHTRPLAVGIQHSTLTNPFNGFINGVRITKGIARYTSNFPAPQAPFPTR